MFQENAGEVEARVRSKMVAQRGEVYDTLDRQIVDFKVMLISRRSEVPSFSCVNWDWKSSSGAQCQKTLTSPTYQGASGHEENPRICTRSAVYLQFSYLQFFTSGSHSLSLPRQPPNAWWCLSHHPLAGDWLLIFLTGAGLNAKDEEETLSKNFIHLVNKPEGLNPLQRD